jgi:hypothetical protein
MMFLLMSVKSEMDQTKALLFLSKKDNSSDSSNERSFAISTVLSSLLRLALLRILL